MKSRNDPSSRGDETVIRPPLGQRPTDDLQPANFSPPGVTIIDLDAGNHPPSGWTLGTVLYQAPPVDAPAERAPSARESSIPTGEARGRKGAEGAPFEVSAASPSRNPIIAAATPLLIFLDQLRLKIFEPDAEMLATQIGRTIREFERHLADAGIPAETAQTAKLALCATADDVIANLPGPGSRDWARLGMLSRFFPSADPGSSFFEALNRVLADPSPHYDLLEFMHLCLCLGFEGQYRQGLVREDCDLERVRRDVYETLRYFQARAEDEISPHWRGLAAPTRRDTARAPFWSLAAAATALAAGCFFLARTIVTLESDALSDKLLALNPSGPVAIERAASFVPLVHNPVSTAQIDRIRAALARDIEVGNVAVEMRGDFIVVEINNRLLFEPGKAETKPEFSPIAANIAAALEPERGPLQIIGHTDNVKPRKSGTFASNYDLSIARAKAVERALSPGLSDPGRAAVDGKGEDEPIADNTTAEGRAANRRVDIMIPRENAQ